MTDHDCDILVIGGGIAGAAVAAHLAEYASVHILEMEDQPGYHATGRSAALFSESYGNATIRALSKASRSFLFSPPPGFCSTPLVRPRPVLIFGRAERRQALEAFARHEVPGTALEAVGAQEALALCPILRADGLLGGFVDRGAADIEVHELHQGYLRAFRQRGGRLSTGVRVVALMHEPAGWLVRSERESFRATVVVNAAGAWAGELGQRAGAQEIGLEPRRRTAVLIEPRQGGETAAWPMLVDAEERFYLKPDAGLFLLSPADETPVPPCDAQPEELDIALAIDRMETATHLEVARLRSKWAGLRSFVPDRSPVVGYDLQQPAFFWLAALGGYGIQTAPALSALAANLVLRRRDDSLAQLGLPKDAIGPERLR